MTAKSWVVAVVCGLLLASSAAAQCVSALGPVSQPVVFPTVAIDKSRIRTIVTAAHADSQLDQALEAFATVGRELGLIAG